MTLDPDGIMDRIVAPPGLPPRSYGGLAPGPEGHVFVLENVPNEPGSVLHRYSLEEREPTRFLEVVQTAETSHDRSRILVRAGPAWRVVDAAGAPPNGSDGRLALDGLPILVEPRAEYAQILRDGRSP